nr:hypothetical protein [Bradyrhizobium liaoningense]
MRAQKIALETCEREVRAVARGFTPNGFHFRQTDLSADRADRVVAARYPSYADLRWGLASGFSRPLPWPASCRPITLGARSRLAKKKKLVCREWTTADIKELKAHSKARTPVVKLAKMTKRTEGALRQKALVLGFGLGHQR